MNCRRVNSLLSAYLDGELTGAEMMGIREHMRECDSCRDEHEALSQTKRLVASLALKTPRAELEALLLREAVSADESWTSRLRWLPAWITDRADSLSVSSGAPAAFPPVSLLRVKPLAATAVLSVAGFWLASVTVDTPSRLSAPAAEVADLFTTSGPGSTGYIAATSASSELSELREIQPISASSMLSGTAAASAIPTGYNGLSAGTVMGAGSSVVPVSAPPPSLSRETSISPVIWQAGGGQGSSVLMSVQRAFFSR